MQGGGSVVATISDSRQSIVLHCMTSPYVCVTEDNGKASVLRLSPDNVVDRCYIGVNNNIIKTDVKEKTLAVFCNICKSMFECLPKLRVHVDKQHTAGNLRICPKEGCQEAFNTGYEFKEHMKVCSYKCPVQGCEFRHKRKRLVESHQRRAHRYITLE